MAAGGAMVDLVNEFFGSSDEVSRALVLAVMESATSVIDAVERANLLDGLPGNLAVEARAVLDGLPPAVDREIMDGLRSALTRSAPITVDWHRRAEIGVDILHDPVSLAVHVVLHTPDGQEFLPS